MGVIVIPKIKIKKQSIQKLKEKKKTVAMELI